MRNFKLFFVALAATLFSTTIFAQSYNSKNGSIVDIFYYMPTAPQSIDIVDFITFMPERHFLESKAPRFLLVDSKKKFSLGIGGVVRGVTSVDFGGIIPTETDEGFQTVFIPTSVGNLPRSQAQMSASTSEIFLKMVGDAGRLGYFTLYTSMNFMGPNFTPQLRKAYVDFCGFSVGQLWSTMTDLNALPPTIDYGGPISYAGYHVPQIRYTRLFADERMQFAFAAENPTLYATYSSHDVEQAQGLPNFVGYMQANMNDGGHIRVSGIFRNMNFKNLVSEKTVDKQGWGVQLSGVNDISRTFKAYYQGIYGEGIASYMNDISNLSYDLVPNKNITGAMLTLPMWGAYGGIQCNFTSSIYSSLTYSYSRLYSVKNYDANGMYKYAQYVVTNLFWDMTDECCVGVEYLFGSKRDHFGAWGKANRANLMVQYNF